ncbi:hypothetical protein H0H92_008693 [Tricholoma furcatifolium]|nr:hypothetical protein H0H92_008693 [Tricholoma furcatifolium]
MADERTLNTKEPQNLAKRFKKLINFRSKSTPQSRSNSPPVMSSNDPALSIDPAPISVEEAAKLRAKYTHFRILVIGRANAGKTTLLKRVCNTDEDPVYNTRGSHNVRDEFIFKNNPEFIFHDSPGFEAGGEKELETVMSFIEEKAKSLEVMDQIHAIWFCFDPDVSRPLVELEKKFFKTQRPGNVPVVAIFTKFDVLSTRVYDMNKDEEENEKNARKTLKEKFEDPLRGYAYPPRAYVRFEAIQEGGKGNHQEQVGELIKQTTASIDNLALKMLFVTVQQNNLEICIDCAVNGYVFENNSIVGHFRIISKSIHTHINQRMT